jgi:alginate O-acetyltransferase complex protein AlgI
MVFSSVEFLFFFLPAVLSAYYLLPVSWRNAVLLFFSLLFYTWGGGEIIFVLLASVAANFVFGRMAETAQAAGTVGPAAWGAGTPWQPGGDRRRQLAILLAAVFNVSLLVYYKYASFLAAQLWNIPGLLEGKPWFDSVVLPIGISFYTFHALSYVVDIYRGEKPAARNIATYCLYITLFPQLIASTRSTASILASTGSCTACSRR